MEAEEHAAGLISAGEWQQAVAALERLYAARVAADDQRAALRAALMLVNVTGLLGQPAAEHGWEQRALRLAEHIGPCVERGYVALCRLGCEYHDPRELLERADTALACAREFGDRELEIRATGDRGLALVSLGRVEEGFALLDESMACIAAGEVHQPSQRGMTACAMLSACQRTGDTMRAEYWCRRLEQDEQLRGSDVLVGHCHLVHGEVEALCGRWDHAEEQVRLCRSHPMNAPMHDVEAAAVLADIRCSQGRYSEATELLAGFEDQIETMPVLARVRLAEGRFGEAAALLRAVARSLSFDVIRLAPVLAQLVDVELRRDNQAAAARAAQRLQALEESCDSNELRALSRLGLARLALHAGHHEDAIEELETALTLLIHLDRPLLSAQIRLELGRAVARAGDVAVARLEIEAALATFSRLKVVPEMAAINELLKDLSRLSVAPAITPVALAGAGESLTRRETEIARLVSDGLSNREIAARLFLSVRTVETHVDRALGKLGFRSRTQLATWVQREAIGAD